MLTRAALPIAALVYLPHLLEEHLAGMADDPILAPALAPFREMAPHHAAYLAFQITFALGLVMTALVDLGERGRRVVLAGLGFALLAEAHHLVRFALTVEPAPGLLTAAPMPIVGALILRGLLPRPAPEPATC